MKIALIVTDKFEDIELLYTKLDELKVTEIIAATTHGFKLLQKYTQDRPDVKVTAGESHNLRRGYMAINEADDVVVLANGKGYRSDRMIANAINEGKNLKIYPYKSDALEVTADDKYAKITLRGNLQRATKIEDISLNKEELDKLIEKLTSIKEKLN